MKKLFILATGMIVAMSAAATPARLDSTVVYEQDVVTSRTYYYYNEAGEQDSIIEITEYYTSKTSIERLANGNVETISWTLTESGWVPNDKTVKLHFDNPNKVGEQTWSYNWDGVWNFNQQRIFVMDDEGYATEMCTYWVWNEQTNAVDENAASKETVVWNKSILPAEFPLLEPFYQMHHMDQTAQQMCVYNKVNGAWQLQRKMENTFDGVVLIQHLDEWYDEETGMVRSANKMDRINVEGGYRLNYYDFGGEWQMSNYELHLTNGNQVIEEQYYADSEEPYLRWENTLDERGNVLLQLRFDPLGEGLTNTERVTYTYDEHNNQTSQLMESRNMATGVWQITYKNEYQYNAAGEMTYCLSLSSLDAETNKWRSGSQSITQYNANGDELCTVRNTLDVAVSTADNLVWLPNSKTCNYYHHDDAVSVPAETVEVAPAATTAQFTWPYVESAYLYNIFVYFHGELFHYYVFNAYGQLMSIRYAPVQGEAASRRLLQQAEATTNGWQFTIQDLEMGEEYTYTFTAEAEDGTELQNLTGSFVTQATTSIFTIETIEDGIRYNLLGQPVGKDYKGIVILNGRKYLQ